MHLSANWNPAAARSTAGNFRAGTELSEKTMTPIRELIEQLAPLIWQERQREAERCAAPHKRESPPYYFLNIAHPTIKRLYLRYLKHSLDGSTLVAPIGDLDRVKFELSLLHPAVLRMLADEYGQEAREIRAAPDAMTIEHQ